MRRALGKMHWLMTLLVGAGCGGQSGSDLFAGGGSGSGGTASSTGGLVATGGVGKTTGGASATSGGASGTNATGGIGTSGTSGSAGLGGASAGAGMGCISAGGKGGNQSGGAAGLPSAGGGGKAGGGAAGGAGKPGGGAGGGAGKPGGGAPTAGAAGQATCEMLMTNLPKLLTTAQSCNAEIDRVPCTGFVSNECGCPVPVDLPNSSAAQAYVSAVAQVKNCGVACPDVLCREPTSARCQTEGGQILGRCVAN